LFAIAATLRSPDLCVFSCSPFASSSLVLRSLKGVQRVAVKIFIRKALACSRFSVCFSSLATQNFHSRYDFSLFFLSFVFSLDFI
jgi:hypothetical protein